MLSVPIAAFSTSLASASDSTGEISYGPEHVFEYDDRPYYDYQISIARLDSSHVLFAYRTDGDHGNLDAATISSGNIITSGEEYPFSTNATYISATALDSTRVLIAYDEAGQGGVAFVATVDKANNNVSFGPGRTQYSANSERTSAVRLDSTHIFIVYYAAAQIITVDSNNNITKGTEYNFPNTNPSDVHHDISVTALSSSKVMIAYNLRKNAGTTDPHFKGVAVVATVSNGTQITYGTPYDFNTNDTDLVAVTALSSSKALIAYQNNGSVGTARVATVAANNNITCGNPCDFHTGAGCIRAAALNGTRVLVVFDDESPGKSGWGTGIIATVSANGGISLGSEYVFNYLEESYYIQATTLDDYHAIISYKDAGNNDYGTAVVATVPNTAPNIPTLVSPPNGSWTNSRIFSATVSDPDGGNVTAKFVIGVTTYTGTTVASGSNSTYTYTTDLNGVTWYAYATDGSLNSGNTANRTAYIDTSAPTVAVTPSGTLTNISPITFTITFSESVTGLTASGITVTNGTKGTLSGSGTTYTLPVTPTAQGAVTCQVIAGAAHDAAGNNNTASNTATVTYDTIAPLAPTLISPANGTITNDNTPTFVWNSVTDQSGVTCTLEIVGRLTKTGLTSTSYTLTGAEALPYGTYSWHVRAVDGAGNIGGWSSSWTLRIDPPITFPYNQGFETGSKMAPINETNWGYRGPWQYKYTVVRTGNYSAGAAIDTKGDDTRRLFVHVDFSSKGCTSISYWYKISSVDNHSRMMRLIGSTNSNTGLEGDGDWFVLMDWTDITYDTSWTQFYACLNLAKFNNQSNCYIKIQAKVIGFPSGQSPNQRTLYIDDFHIETSALPIEAWNVTYDSGYSDVARAVAVSEIGDFVYVTGSAQGVAWCTIKYDSEDGGIIWTRTDDSDGDYNIARDVAVDSLGLGFVYVVGTTGYYSPNSKQCIRIIKYDSDGDVIWNKIYDNGRTWVNGVTVDSHGNVYVAGSWDNPGDPYMFYNYLTIKYDSNGNLIWARTYVTGEEAESVAVDFNGNVYVTGMSATGDILGWCTLKYSSNGDLIWSKIQESGENPYATDVAVDHIGNVYVTGISGWGDEFSQWHTVKYDSNGNVLWERKYGFDGEDWNWAESVAVDFRGNVYVTGSSGNWLNTDYRTIKYGPNGEVIWNIAYDSGGNDRSLGVAVDHFGNAYVTGCSGIWANPDYRTIKYM